MAVAACPEIAPSNFADLLTPEQTATLLTMSPRTLERWRTVGEGPKWVRVGLRRVAYPRSGIEAWTSGRINLLPDSPKVEPEPISKSA